MSISSWACQISSTWIHGCQKKQSFEELQIERRGYIPRGAGSVPLQSALSEDQHVNSCSTPILSLWVIYFIAPIEFELCIEIWHKKILINTLSSEWFCRKHSSSCHHFPVKVQPRWYPVLREAAMKKISCCRILGCLSNISTTFSAKFQGDKGTVFQFIEHRQKICVTLLSQQLHKPNVAVSKHHSRCHGQKSILLKLKAFICGCRKQVEECPCDTKDLFMYMQWLEDAIKPKHEKKDWLGLPSKWFKGQKPWVSAGF